jgi:low temperature requirement protein LtrA
MKERPRSLLRDKGTHDSSRVTYVELFYDLVFVFAVTQLSHSLLHHFTWTGLLETTFLALAVWWVWIYTTWVTNWLDPQTVPVRLMLFLLMLAGLFLTMSIPSAFGRLAPVFTSAYVLMQVGRSVFMCWSMKGRDQTLHIGFLRISCWVMLSGLFWLLGAFGGEETRPFFWIVALFLEYLSPAVGYHVPGLGRSTTADWQVSGAHMAERCALFIIIALGESVLVTGATVAELSWTPLSMAAFLVAFLGSIAMWWVYFHIEAERASQLIAESTDPGRLARLAYTYIHILIVAGIILAAVSDEVILSHPERPAEPLAAFAILGGPGLFLLGNLLFKRAVFGHYALWHLTGILLLVLAATASAALPALALAGFATGVLILTGSWESIAARRRAVTMEMEAKA